MLAEDHPTLYAFTRALKGTKLLILGNVSGDTLTLPDDPSLQHCEPAGTLLLGNYDGELTPALRPWEVRVLQIS